MRVLRKWRDAAEIVNLTLCILLRLESRLPPIRKMHPFDSYAHRLRFNRGTVD